MTETRRRGGFVFALAAWILAVFAILSVTGLMQSVGAVYSGLELEWWGASVAAHSDLVAIMFIIAVTVGLAVASRATSAARWVTVVFVATALLLLLLYVMYVYLPKGALLAQGERTRREEVRL